MTIFRNIDELREYITVDVSSTLDVVMPYLMQAERYVRNITGDELFDLLVQYTEAGTGGDARLDALLPKCRLPLANFGYMLAVEKLNVNVGNTGITVTVSNNVEPASQWRVDAFKRSLEESGNTALELLIQFLEANRSDYPEWVSSPAYSFGKRYFVNNATEFTDATGKSISRLEFLKLREYIQLAEVEIRGILCDDLFEEVKNEFRDEMLSEKNEMLMSFIVPAVCYSALDKRSENVLYRNEANRLLESLRIYLNRNAESYPLYVASDCYSDSSDEIDYGDSCVYGFGV